MTLRTDTVEYVFDTRTTVLNAATRHDFSSITLYIPETTSRRFVSVILEIQCRENVSAAGSNFTSRMLGIKLGAVAFSDDTRSDTVLSTSVPFGFKFIRDVTSYFTANFGSGTSQTCQAGIQIGGVATQTITAKLFITYEFDDSAATRVKTVKIPLDSPTAQLTNTLTEIGTNQVPKLTSSGLLPEDSITIRDIWFELQGNDDIETSTDYNLAVSLDAEAEVSMGLWEANQVYKRYFFAIWRRPDMSTTTTHAFKARSTTTNRVGNLAVLLCVSYEYSSSSATILNSIEMALPRLSNQLGTPDTAAEQYRSSIDFLIAEPGTITLKQSGVLLTYDSHANNQLTTLLRVGGQSYRTYTVCSNFSTAYSSIGEWTIMQRIDSGGAQGAGVTLSRGMNTLTVDVYSTTSDGESNHLGVDCVAYINYTSDRHELGPSVHNRTLRYLVKDTTYTASHVVKPSIGIDIADPMYWISNVTWLSRALVPGETLLVADMHLDPDEGDAGGGWASLSIFSAYHTENLALTTALDVSRRFRRHPFDPDDTRAWIERIRTWRIGIMHTASTSESDALVDGQMLVTLSSIAFVCERTVTPAVDNVSINTFRDTRKGHVYRSTSDPAGNFQFICYSDTDPLFNEGYQSGAYSGRSFTYAPTGFSYNTAWTPAGLSGLAIWLRADLGVTTAGGTVSAWTDQSGSSNNAAQGTAGFRPTNTLIDGDNKPSIAFDGTDDQLDVTDAASFGSTAAFSVSCWIRTGSTFPTDGTIIAQWGATERFYLKVATGGNVVVGVSAGTAATATVSAALAASRWYHLAFTYDGAGTGNAGRLKLYIDGARQDPTYSGTVPASVGNPTTVLSIGSRNTASTYFNGSVDDVVFVNGRALSQTEVQYLLWYRRRY